MIFLSFLNNSSFNNLNYLTNKPQKGLTFLELLIVIALSGIVLTVAVLVDRTSFSSYRLGHERSVVQDVLQELANKMIEGDFGSSGLKDACRLIHASKDSVTFLPLWVDDTHTGNGSTTDFVLNRQFKPGAPNPITQVDDGVQESTFGYGAGSTDDIVTFAAAPDNGSSIQIIFQPEDNLDNSVRMQYQWDAENKTLTRTYAGQSEDFLKDVIKHHWAVKLLDPNWDGDGEKIFSYYDKNDNEILPKGLATELSASQLRSVSKILLTLEAEKGNERSKVISSVNLRSRVIGQVFTKDDIARGDNKITDVASSSNVSAFLLTNLTNVQDNDVVEIKVTGDNIWGIRITFRPSGPSTTYEIKYNGVAAPASPCYVINEIPSQIDFLNLNDAYTDDEDYDYDYGDGSAAEAVNVKGANIILEITRMDIDGACLIIEP